MHAIVHMHYVCVNFAAVIKLDTQAWLMHLCGGRCIFLPVSQEPSEPALKSESSAEDEGGGVGEGSREDDDQADAGVKDMEAERIKYLGKRQ